MNQNQRKFLLEAIDKQFRAEMERLKERKPKAPSLNNYLIAAVLDGSFEMKDAETMRSALRERVRDLGKDDTLTKTNGDRWSRRSSLDGEEAEMVYIPALLMFEEPPGYTEARAKYEAARAAWEQEMSSLDAAHRAMQLKVQIGSDKALSVLVDQADKLCSMSLTASSSLLLAAPKD